MSDVNCPYCDAELEICTDDGHGCEEGVTYEQPCSSCDKHFVFTASISYHYEPYKADCLNGAPHNYKPTKTFPKAFTRMCCEWCDEERKLSDDERKSLGVETPAEYFENLKKATP